MKTKTLISTAVSILVLASCAGGGDILTDIYEDSATVAVAEGSPNEMSVSVTIEYPAGGVPAEAADRMTSAILKEALGADTGVVAEAVEHYISTVSEEYRSECSDLAEDFNGLEELVGALCWERQVSVLYHGSHNGISSFSAITYDYSGGAHGSTVERCLNFRLSDGSPVTETDLFIDGYADTLSGLLSARLGMAFSNPEDYDALFIKDIEPNGNFLVSEEGITYVYGQYEIGPYSLGTIEVSLAWEELEGLLR